MEEDEMIEKMAKMVEHGKKQSALMDKTIGLLLPAINIDLPTDIQGKIALNSIETAYESSLINVENILILPIPTQYVAHSNFLFGKMFGKTELLLQIMKKKVD